MIKAIPVTGCCPARLAFFYQKKKKKKVCVHTSVCNAGDMHVHAHVCSGVLCPDWSTVPKFADWMLAKSREVHVSRSQYAQPHSLAYTH